MPSVPSSARGSNGPTRLRRFGYWAGILPAGFIVAFFLLIPLAGVAAFSFMAANEYGGVVPRFSLDAYVQLLFEQQLDLSMAFTDSYLVITLRSVLLAFATLTIVLLVGFPVATFIAMQPSSRRNSLILLITIPFFANTLVRTYCWVLMLRDTGVVNNVLQSTGLTTHPVQFLYTNSAILVGLVYSYAPFMILPIYASLEKLDTRLIEAAYDLYASKWQVLRRVIWPAAKPGVIAGCLLTFIPSLGAQISPDLLGGGKHMMFGNLIFRQFTDARNWPFGSALAMILLSLVLLAGLIYLFRVRASRTRPWHSA